MKYCICNAQNRRAKDHLATLENNQHSHGPEVYGVEKTRHSEVELVQKACQYLLSDLSLNISLEELAHKIATNRNKLSQASKNVLGRGIFSWLRGERMKEAKRLCITTDLPLQEIGYQVGHSNQATFSTAFKAYFKLSPRQCRKNDGI
ncbi:MAG: AraC family transcriptional regulator [Pseudomonadales bacterium]